MSPAGLSDMRRIFSIVGIAFLLAACNKPQKPATTISDDAKLSQMVVGIWEESHGVIEIDEDGFWTSRFTNVWDGKRVVNFYQCEWKISNSCMVVTVDNVVTENTNNERAGSIDRMRIISVDATNMVWESQVRVVSNNMVTPGVVDESLRRIK